MNTSLLAVRARKLFAQLIGNVIHDTTQALSPKSGGEVSVRIRKKIPGRPPPPKLTRTGGRSRSGHILSSAELPGPVFEVCRAQTRFWVSRGAFSQAHSRYRSAFLTGSTAGNDCGRCRHLQNEMYAPSYRGYTLVFNGAISRNLDRSRSGEIARD